VCQSLIIVDNLDRVLVFVSFAERVSLQRWLDD
jgi:hypothetical protein